MNKIITSGVFCLIMFSGCFGYVRAEVISNSGKSNIMITSPEFVNAKRNTELKWTWIALKNTDKVDVYLINKNKKYSFAKDYPNSGNFWWATGYLYDEWKIKNFKNGENQIAVCPAGTNKIDQSCGVFTVNIYGDVPILKLISPRGGSKFSIGDTIKVLFSGAKVGEKYKVSLLYPAKVSPIETLLGTGIADINGNESFEFSVPEKLKNGVYTLEIIQETNNGSCLNVCARVESKPIKIK